MPALFERISAFSADIAGAAVSMPIARIYRIGTRRRIAVSREPLRQSPCALSFQLFFRAGVRYTFIIVTKYANTAQ